MSSAFGVANDKFISGGGKMGSLIRSKDWNSTSLGSINQWPQSLLIILDIMLSSKFPMFLWWGKELTCFYNDSYRPSLGNYGKHPSILGLPAKEAWSEIWDLINPLIEQVMSGGESVWQENQLVPIYRDGHLADVYWTFSYSPVKNETGNIAGVLVVCTETTDLVLRTNALAESETRFRNLVNDAFIATAIFKGKDFVIDLANDEALKLWGKDLSIIGKPLAEAIPELKDQPYLKILYNVFSTGKTYEGKEELVWLDIDGVLTPTYVDFIYKALSDNQGNIYGILAMGNEVTDQVMARNKIAEAEERTRLAVDSALLGTFEINLETDEVICSARFCEIFGFKNATPSHQQFIDAIHPDDLPLRNRANEEVFKTGFLFYEVRIRLPDRSIHWISAQGKLFYNSNRKPVTLLGTIKDITREKNYLHIIHESERKFRNSVMQAPVGIAILKGDDFVVELANESYLQLVDKLEKDFVGKPLFESLPELQSVVEPLLKGVLTSGVPYLADELNVLLNRYGRQESTFFNLIYQPLLESDGQMTGIIVIAFEVTLQVEAKNALFEKEMQFRRLVTESPIAMTLLKGEDLVIDLTNPSVLAIWKKERHEVEGKKLMDVFPELQRQRFPGLLKQVFNSGIVHKENEAMILVGNASGSMKYFLDFEYAPLFESDGKVSGIMITAVDVSEKVEARMQIKEAAERLLLATEGTQMGTWDLNLQSFEMIHSHRLAEIFGYDGSQKLSHEKMQEHIHPDDKTKIVDNAFEMALQTGVYHYEARINHSDNSLHWIRTRGKVIFDDAYNPQRMLGTIIDITADKRSLQIIEENERKFKILANSMAQFIWTADPDGKLNYFNQAVYQYSGLTPDQIDENGWLQIVHPDDRAENITQWIQAVSTGEPFLFEHRFRRHDGEYRWQLSRAIPQRDDNGVLQMWVGTSTDIDELKRHDQQKDDFIKIASHELKTPVTTIKGYVQLLLKTYGQGTDSFLSGSLTTIDKQVSKLTKLITDLLDLTKIETGSFDLVREKFSLTKMVTEVVKDFHATSQTHAITVNHQVDAKVWADKNRIEQVLINLITNAVKYSPSADRILIEVTETGGMAMISVQDFGIGIDSDDYQKIFDRFYRVSGKMKKPFRDLALVFSL